MTAQKYTMLSFDDYLRLPLEKREVFRWFWPLGKWYLPPEYMGVEDWRKFSEYAKEHYVIQNFLRTKAKYALIGMAGAVGEWRDYLFGLVFNPRKEMRAALFPPLEMDLEDMVVAFHFQVLREYALRRFGLVNASHFKHTKGIEFFCELSECIDYVVEGRDAHRGKITKVHSRWSEATDEKEKIAIINELDKLGRELIENDTKVCEWVVANRHHFYTY